MQELPKGAKHKRGPLFPRIPKTSKRPFLLSFIGYMLLLGGGLAMVVALMPFAKLSAGASLAGAGLQARGRLLEGVSGLMGLSVGYAIIREKAWGRLGLLIFILLVNTIHQWLDSTKAISLGGLVRSSLQQSTLTTLAFMIWYLYLWPNVTDYYRRLKGVGGEPPNSYEAPGCQGVDVP